MTIYVNNSFSFYITIFLNSVFFVYHVNSLTPTKVGYMIQEKSMPQKYVIIVYIYTTYTEKMTFPS